MGGTWGALATGLFASKLINEAGNNGLFFGNAAQLGIQALSVVAAWVYSFVAHLAHSQGPGCHHGPESQR